VYTLRILHPHCLCADVIAPKERICGMKDKANASGELRQQVGGREGHKFKGAGTEIVSDLHSGTSKRDIF